jgi:hypothetical protein
MRRELPICRYPVPPHMPKSSVDRINILNAGLMVLSCLIAYVLPFELPSSRTRFACTIDRSCGCDRDTSRATGGANKGHHSRPAMVVHAFAVAHTRTKRWYQFGRSACSRRSSRHGCPRFHCRRDRAFAWSGSALTLSCIPDHHDRSVFVFTAVLSCRALKSHSLSALISSLFSPRAAFFLFVPSVQA